MIEANPLIEFNFTLEKGVSESEIETLWEATKQAQIAMDRFLAGDIGELELTDYLEFYDINTGETLEILEENAQYMGLILP